MPISRPPSSRMVWRTDWLRCDGQNQWRTEKLRSFLGGQSCFFLFLVPHLNRWLQIGTSAVVYPAAGFASLMATQGIPVAEINIEKTATTGVSTYVLIFSNRFGNEMFSRSGFISKDLPVKYFLNFWLQHRTEGTIYIVIPITYKYNTEYSFFNH